MLVEYVLVSIRRCLGFEKKSTSNSLGKKERKRERERERERKRAQETSGPVLETPSELGSEAILQRLACLALLQLGLACTKASGLGRDETWLLTD